MDADKLAKNTLNATKMFCPICLPKPKSLGFLRKSSFWVSVVREVDNWIIEKIEALYEAFYIDIYIDKSVSINLQLRKKRSEAYTFLSL